MQKYIYAILSLIFISLSLVGSLILVQQKQETRRQATCTTGGGGCGNPDCCRSWEVYQNGCCHSTSGCSSNSDCADGKLCVNGVCQGATPPSCDSCSGSGTKCDGSYFKYCDGACWREDPARNGQCAAPSGAQPTIPQQNLCQGVADSGCTSGGRGGVDCAACRSQGGQVKQCQGGTWYCCYGDGNCYQGTAQTQVVCSGQTITNNSGQTLSGNIYSGCNNGNKIGSFSLSNGQSRSAASCTQIDVPGFCGVCNSSNCLPTPPPSNNVTSTPKPTNTPTPTSRPTNTPTPTQRPTNTPTPTRRPTITNTPTGTLIPTATPTLTPILTATPTPTSTPLTTTTPVPTQVPTNIPTLVPTDVIVFRPPGPTNAVLPQTGLDTPSVGLVIISAIVTLSGILILL